MVLPPIDAVYITLLFSPLFCYFYYASPFHLLYVVDIDYQRYFAKITGRFSRLTMLADTYVYYRANIICALCAMTYDEA